MKIRSITYWLCLASAALPVSADIFIMNDGTKYEGTIIRQDPTSYVVEVQVTKTIKDERTLAKADVTKIEPSQPDLTAFEGVANLIPVPDMLTPVEYTARIAKVEKFLVTHKGSVKSKNAREILATLKSEADEILTGGIKMNGKMIPPSEYRANAYDIDSRIQEIKIRALAKDGQTLKALRTFSEFEREFKNTSAYSTLLPFIIQVINAYLREVELLQTSFDTRSKERLAGLERMTTSDRTITERAISEETSALTIRLKQEKDTAIGWVTPDPFLKPSLDDTLTFGRLELTRLSAPKNTTLGDGGKLFREALIEIQKGGENKAAVTSAIKAAETAGVGKKYITILTDTAREKGIKL